MLRIMIVGNSHSNDAFWLLNEVFKAQMPEQEVVLGIMYYSGCSVARHIKFTEEKQSVYRYYRNTGDTWEVFKDVPMETGLEDQPWDIVFLQPGRADLDETMNREGRRTLEGIIARCVPNPHKLMWHTSWPSPSDPYFFSPEYVVQPPAGMVEYLRTRYGHDTFKQFAALTEKSKASIVTDKTYEKAICTGAGIMYAYAGLGVSQRNLWRDYTHLADFGRLIAAHSFYTQFTGEPITQVNIDRIPAELRHRRARELGDLEITEEMKQVLIAAANHALEDPWTVPAKPE